MSIVELRESLDEVQRDLDELTVSCYGNEEAARCASLPLLEQEQSILAAIRDESVANARDLAYEAEEARLLGLRVRG